MEFVDIRNIVKDEGELAKLALPCIMIDLGADALPIRVYQKSALEDMVNSDKALAVGNLQILDNQQLGVVYYKEGRIKWLGALAPNKLQFVMNVFENLTTMIVTEDMQVIDGSYIDAYIR